MMRATLLCIVSLSAFAAQDATITNAFTLSNTSVPAQSGHCTLEFVIDNQPSVPTSGALFSDNPCGMNAQWVFGGQPFLQFYWTRGTGGAVSGIPFDTSLHVIRFQVDPVANTHQLDAWNQSCVSTYTQTVQYSGHSGSNSNGQSITATDATGFRLSWLRLSTDTFAAAQNCPTTAATGRTFLAHWKFEGNLNDSSGNGRTLSGGSPAYNATPSAFATLVVSGMCSGLCSAQPAYTGLLPAGTAISVKVGQANTWEAIGFSQTDSSSSVTFVWSVLSSPGSSSWSSFIVPTPTVTLNVFGDYAVQVVATDAVANTATSTTHVGAVVVDANGVVTNSDGNVDFLLGPMIAFGRNPWGYQDYWTAHASSLRSAGYVSSGWVTGASNKPQWEYTGQGTVSFYFNCVGPPVFCNTGLGTTLNGSILATDTTITVTDATKLDLTTFPTHIILYAGSTEEIRICSAAGNVLTVCYDGRGQSPLAFGNATAVLQAKVTGSGTKFLTDPTAPVCPVGAPGPPGPSLYSTGTVTLTAGSATMVGTGTFTADMVGDYVRVPATHSAVAFIFVAQISAFVDAAHVTLARVYPSTADTTAGLAYDIMKAQRTVVLRYPHATDPSGDGELMWGTAGGCESETALYTNPIQAGNTFDTGHDIAALDGTHVTGKTYGITDTTGWVTNNNFLGGFGISFYGESLAHEALYRRSGLDAPKTAAAYLEPWWVKSPWGNADSPKGLLLETGGEVIGAFVAAILHGTVAWPDLRGWAATGVQQVTRIAVSCNADDTRDTGYAYTPLILAAIYDPDTTSTAAPGGIPWRTYWQNGLAQMQTNDTNCQRSDNSFANGLYFNPAASAITVTNGSAAATGTGLPSSLCNGTASGTATLTNGSNAVSVLTGSIPGGTTALFLTGTTGGSTVFVQSLAYGGGVLGGMWLGDSGTVSWISGNFDGYPGSGSASDMLTIATSNDDLTNLKKNWACTWNNSSSITLNRAWDGSNGTFHAYNANLAGYGQQPFMLGIKSYGENLLGTQTLAALSSYVTPYQTFTANSTSWIWNTGMDPQLFSSSYGRVFQACEPTNTIPGGTTFTFRAPGCTYGADPIGTVLAREINSETGTALTLFYKNNVSGPNKLLGDQYYGALWGSTAYNTGGVFQDANSVANNLAVSNLTDANINGGKWFGFFAGVGMSHRWPAMRISAATPQSKLSGSVKVSGKAVVH